MSARAGMRPIVKKVPSNKPGQTGAKTTIKTGVAKKPAGDPKANAFLKGRTQIAVPRSDMLSNFGLDRCVSSAYHAGDYGQIEELPALSSGTDDKFNERLQQKLHQCRLICNFADPLADLKSKQIKRCSLQEILDHISTPKYYKMMDSESIRLLFVMVKSNIIRAIPPIPALAKVPMIGDDINDTIYESAWPHLDLVYQVFLKFLESSFLDVQVVLPYVNTHFISQFLSLLSTSDQRERDALKMVLHRLYLRFVPQRQQIRQSIQYVFYTYLYEVKYFLELMSSLKS